MMSNSVALKELRDSWAGVSMLRGKVQGALVGSVTQPGSFAIFIADAAHNLPFIHACSVLNEVLLQFREEKFFECRSIFLGALMDSSKDRISWVNFDLVKEGIERRNDAVHRAEIVARSDCWKYIDAIAAELSSWGVIDVPE